MPPLTPPEVRQRSQFAQLMIDSGSDKIVAYHINHFSLGEITWDEAMFGMICHLLEQKRDTIKRLEATEQRANRLAEMTDEIFDLVRRHLPCPRNPTPAPTSTT